MLAKLFLVFLAVPLAEIILFIEIGSRIGTWITLLIVLLTAVFGASLAQREGLKTWRRLQEKLSRNRPTINNIAQPNPRQRAHDARVSVAGGWAILYALGASL